MSFGARDLALLLPNEVGDTIAFNATENDDEGPSQPTLIPKVDASKKTRRYFPGQAPAFAGPSSDEVEEVTITIDGGPPAEKEIDRRLARISGSKTSTSGSSRRRRIYEAEVVVDDNDVAGSKSGEDCFRDGDVLEGDSLFLKRLEEQRDEDEDDIAARRQRIKERLASRREAEDGQESIMVSGGVVREARRETPAEESSGSSEYETDSDEESDEEEEGRTMLKPLFVPRARRETIRSQEEIDREKEAAQQKEMLQNASKKQQTRVMVAESIRRQEELEAKGDVTDMDSDAGLPDDSDDVEDEDAQFDQWRVREMGRMKRDAETREAMLLEAQDIERRRNMTDEERLAEDIKLGKFREKEKKKWKFLQKYYHKGVFYMDEDSVGSSLKIGTRIDAPNTQEKAASKDRAEVDARLREYNEPTLEDNYNKDALPSVLQVKKFGLRGRTKYTHLVDQDTTDFKQGYRLDDRVKSSYMEKRSGVGDINTAGRHRKKARHE